MSIKLQCFPEYRSTRIGWLDTCPSHWHDSRVKLHFREKEARKGNADIPLLSLTRQRGLVAHASVSNKMPSAEDLSNYKVCAPGDLVMNRMQAWSGMFAASTTNGVVSPDYSVFEITNGNVEYFEKLFRSPRLVEQFALASKGIGTGFNRLYTPEFGAIRIPVPPPEEQEVIVRFIRHLDHHVNRLVQAKRRLIDLLNEQRQAIIHRAVTRGLDPTVPLKPSGVDWLGDIPAHWHIHRIASLASTLQTGPFGSQLHSHEYVEGGVPVINPSHMANGRIVPDPRCSVSMQKAKQLERHRCLEGDVLFARRGELGRCALVTSHDEGCLCGTGSLMMRVLDTKVAGDYLVHLLQLAGPREWLSLRSVGSTMENLNTRILANLPLPIPPRSEQTTILRHISKELTAVETVIGKTESEIDLIREYRTRLVSDVVTGQLDVRHLDLPDVEEEPEMLADEAEDVELDEMADDELLEDVV